MAISGADEIYRKISSQIESQFPEFIRSDGPKFVSFLKAYFEYMEQTGKAGERARALLDLQDIDRTIDEFVEYFRREFMVNIPKNVQGDKRLLAKYIRDYYRTRGSEESMRFLFRTIYNQEIELYYPGDDILRASDGRWAQETVLYVKDPSNVNPTTFAGKKVTGTISGATGQVQNVVAINTRGIDAYQITIESRTGVFVDGERIQDEDGKFATILGTSGTIAELKIIDGGAFHSVGDTLQVFGQSSGATATATVLSVKNDPTNQGLVFRIVDGGRGYTLGNTNITVSGGSGTDGVVSVLSISNTTSFQINKDRINSVKDVLLNTGLTFSTGGSNTTVLSANLASANVSSSLISALDISNTTIGSINAISMSSAGYGYSSLPIVTAIESEIAPTETAAPDGGILGRNAVIVANNATGALLTVSITSSSLGFEQGETASIVNQRTGTQVTTNSREVRNKVAGSSSLGAWVGFRREDTYPGSGAIRTSGTINLPGRYTDTKGFLSWNMRLQDNDYYQEYSYVIKVMKEVEKYRDILKSTVHPAGTKQFGEYTLRLTANNRPAVMFTIDARLLVSESFRSTDSFSVLRIDQGGIIGPETITLTDTPDATNKAVASITETITAADSVDATTKAVGDLSETVTSGDDVDATNKAVASISELVVVTDEFVGGTSTSASYFDSTGYIEPYANTEITFYETKTVGDFIAETLNFDDTLEVTIS